MRTLIGQSERKKQKYNLVDSISDLKSLDARRVLQNNFIRLTDVLGFYQNLVTKGKDNAIIQDIFSENETEFPADIYWNIETTPPEYSWLIAATAIYFELSERDFFMIFKREHLSRSKLSFLGLPSALPSIYRRNKKVSPISYSEIAENLYEQARAVYTIYTAVKEAEKNNQELPKIAINWE